MIEKTTSPAELGAALALIALGPQRSADANEWWRVSLEMCQHCQGRETATEAAARIIGGAHAVLSDFARTAPGLLPYAVQGALAPWRPNAESIRAESSFQCDCKDSVIRWVDDTHPHPATNRKGWICMGCLTEYVQRHRLTDIEIERNAWLTKEGDMKEHVRSLKTVIEIAQKEITSLHNAIVVAPATLEPESKNDVVAGSSRTTCSSAELPTNTDNTKD